MTSSYADQFFGVDMHDVDPLTETLIRLEEERQRRRIILIPSESYVPQSVRQGLGSVFTNIYAEGYPPSQMVGDDEELLAELGYRAVVVGDGNSACQEYSKARSAGKRFDGVMLDLTIPG
ncbi:MAG: hypothetical protein AB8I80_05995, partial [Anaerolineae bacterium]